jgi:hypothetical protein
VTGFLFFESCQQAPPTTAVENQVFMQDSLPRSHSSILGEDLSDSLWINDVINKWYGGFTDSTLRPVHLVQAPKRDDSIKHVIVCEQALCALSYVRDGDFMRITYLAANEIVVHVLWYNQELIFTEEYCFNDSWGRCGVGFRRSMVYRQGQIIHEYFASPGTDTKESFESDMCNCMKPLDLQIIQLMRQKCLTHERIQKSDL